MTRRPIAALAVLGVAGLAATATAQATTPDSHHQRSPYRYRATVDQTSGLNAQGVPGRLGGRGTLHAKLRTSQHPHGAVVGTVELELQTTSTHYPSTILEIGTIHLHHFTLAVQGVQVEGKPSAPLAITGATGDRIGRQGTVMISDSGTVTIRFTRT